MAENTALLVVVILICVISVLICIFHMMEYMIFRYIRGVSKKVVPLDV